MAYEKIADSIDASLDIIKFSYSADDLFNIVSLKTMYRARNIKNDKGESQIDDFAISEAERDAFNVFLETAANLVFRTVLKMAKGVSHAIIINTSANVELGIRDNASYNENILDYVDNLIKDTIVYKVISEWYKTCGLDQEYTKIENNYLTNNQLLINGLFELRKPLIS